MANDMKNLNAPKPTAAPQQQATPAPAAVESVAAPQPTAKALVGFLSETGTPSGKLKSAQEWLKENPEGTAGELYQHLESKGVVLLGTLRKAGKFVYGDSFEPKTNTIVPEDELAGLRMQVERLKKDLDSVNAQNLSQQRQIKAMGAKNNELTTELQALRGTRHPEDAYAGAR
jgi:hypothetical protein